MSLLGRRKSLAHRLGQLASPKTVFALSVGIAILFRKNPRIWQVPVATALAVALTDLLKLDVNERRPALFCKEEWSSFPSGHSASTAALCLSMAHVTREPAAYVAAAVLAGGVNTLRVKTKKHWPHDVLAGDSIAAAAVMLTALMAPRLLRKEA